MEDVCDECKKKKKCRHPTNTLFAFRIFVSFKLNRVKVNGTLFSLLFFFFFMILHFSYNSSFVLLRRFASLSLSLTSLICFSSFQNIFSKEKFHTEFSLLQKLASLFIFVSFFFFHMKIASFIKRVVSLCMVFYNLNCVDGRPTFETVSFFFLLLLFFSFFGRHQRHHRLTLFSFPVDRDGNQEK